MKVLVTGATGFIGSWFIRESQKKGILLRGIKRYNSICRIPVKENIEWIDYDFNNSSCLDKNKMFKDVDIVVHLLSHGVSPQPACWGQCLKINVSSSFNFINQAVEFGIKKFIVLGSCMEYGNSGNLYDFIPSNAPLRPEGPYACSKAAASIAFLGLAKEKNLLLTLIRPFNVYGEGQYKKNLWPSLTEAAILGDDFPMTKGEQIRDFQKVEDLVHFIINELDFENAIPGAPNIINSGSGVPRSILNFVMENWQNLGAKGNILPGKLPYRKNEVFRYVPAINKYSNH